MFHQKRDTMLAQCWRISIGPVPHLYLDIEKLSQVICPRAFQLPNNIVEIDQK